MLGKLVKSSLLLLILNLSGGFLHYLFQVVAARRLGLSDYAELIVAMSFYQILFSLSSVMQYFAVMRSRSRAGHATLVVLTVVSAVLGVAACTVVLAGYSTPSLLLILLLTYPSALLAGFWLGTLQGWQAFMAFGLSFFAGAVTKFGGALVSVTKQQYALSVAALAIIMMLAAFIFYLHHARKGGADVAAGAGGSGWRDLALSSLAAFGFVIYPIFDLLNVRMLFESETVGKYGQLQLFSKMLYFAPATLLQVTFPYYVKAFESGVTLSEHIKVRLLEIAGLAASYIGALVFAVAGPAIATKAIGSHTLETREIFLACASMVPLYGLMSSLQVSASSKSILHCVVFVSVVLVSPTIARLAGFSSLDDYLVFSVIINTLFGLAGFAASEWRIRRLCRV